MTVDPAVFRDPRKLLRLLWPDVRLYDRQWEIVEAVWSTHETVCIAGSQLGKDFVAALIVLLFFLTREPCRVVTTSVDHNQLEAVLWGEMRKFIQTSRFPLTADQGGPLLCNHLHLRKVYGGQVQPLSYVIGRVAKQGEGILGHHLPAGPAGAPRTLFLSDEASAVDDQTYDAADTWAHRTLLIGNPWPTSNRFYRAVREGDNRWRRVLRIRAEDSPNVRLALGQKRRAEPITGEVLVPGVLSFSEYERRRQTWDPMRQTICLDAEWYEGREALLFPPLLLDAAADRADALAAAGGPRRALALGIDSGEGRSHTVWALGDEEGLIDLWAVRTLDTAEVVRRTRAIAREHYLDPENVLFDRGGGGRQHADRLREMGLDVQDLSFGAASTDDRGIYSGMRSQLFGQLEERLHRGWAIPRRFAELRRQLSVLPRRLDPEGRLTLPKKSGGPDSLEAMLGRSPDEADAVALLVHMLSNQPETAGALC